MSAQFVKIKEAILGKRYDLSFAFLNPVQMRKAMKYKARPSKKISNVLAFPLSKTSGEILICKEAAAPYTPLYLFIHGCLHLKGHKHNATMDSEETRIMKRFGLATYATNRNRNRRRHVSR